MATVANMRKRYGGLFDLRHLKFAVVAGAATTTDITITGLQTTDVLLACFEVQPPTAGTLGALIAERVGAGTVAITADATIRVNTTTSLGNQLFVVWYDEVL